MRIGLACACLAAASPVFAGGPLVISHGGTYRGEWTSDDPNTPAIRIVTKEPVVIEGSTVRGRGKLIDADHGDADVIVRDVHGIGLNPNVPDRAAGRFFTGEEVARVVIEHCQLDGTAGIYIYRTSPAVKDAEITVRCNAVRDIDGRFSDGHEGYRDFNIRKRLSDGRTEEGMDYVQFLQLNGVAGLARGEIAWNHVVNEPGVSRVEDNISLYETSGRPGAPLRVHDNCVVGAYTIDPSRRDVTAGGWQEDWAYSGGGIMLGDGPGKTLATASGFLACENNVVLSTGNYGIGVAGGHDIRVTGNRVLGSGRLTDGRTVLTQNVGIYVWDIAKGRLREPPTCFAVSGSGNTVGWWNAADAKRNDWWVPQATTWADNVRFAGPLMPDQETTEQAQWLLRAKAAGITVGLTMNGPATRPAGGN